MRLINIFRQAILLCLLVLSLPLTVWADETPLRRILVITSYNPDTQKMYENLSNFVNECQQCEELQVEVSIESMNCKNLSESHLWKKRMASLLEKYKTKRPSLVILLGQEAWASYLSQTSEFARSIPVMGGLVSTNTILLPDDSVDLRTWVPESKEYTEITDFNIVGGVFYHYDVDRNVRLMRYFYPQMTTLAFLSDNTFGGLSMQALVRKRMKKYPQLRLQLIDGRVKSLGQVKHMLGSMPSSTVMLVGTWRIDCTENYVLGNTNEELSKANPHLGAFTMSSVGMGNWVIGGFHPQYGAIGRDLADAALVCLGCDKPGLKKFTVRPCNYAFDAVKLHQFGFDAMTLPVGSNVINRTPNFYEQYHLLIHWGLGIFAFLSVGLVIALYYIVRIHRLKSMLEKQSEELLVAKDKAEEANRLKTSFIANMSHEIRTPLNAIVGFSDLLAHGDFEEADKVQFSHIIQENSDLLLNLINDILDIARIESGKITLVSEKCDVIDLCHTSLVSVKQARPLENVEYQESLPSGQLVIMTDPMRLKQVLINLLTNASKFTKEGHIRLTLSVDKARKLMTFDVSDTGIGIPADKAEHVFERFVKLNPYAQGTGLGLAICRLIVERLGGNIKVDTSYTGGARFVFTHPLVEVDTSQEDEKQKNIKQEK